MKTQNAYYARLTGWVGLGMLAATLCLPAVTARAETVTQKGRDTVQCTDEKYIEIGDVPEHYVGVYKCEGVSSPEGGEVGVLELWGTGDFIAGSGPEQGYYTVTYVDGSTVRGNWQDTLMAAKDGTTSGKGTYNITSGTGRLAGVKGKGTYTITSFSGKSWIDWTETYTVP
jgi:hypothetical protein